MTTKFDGTTPLNPEASTHLQKLLADVLHDLDHTFTELGEKYTEQVKALIVAQEGADSPQLAKAGAEAEAAVLVGLGALYTAVVRTLAEHSPTDAMSVIRAAAHLASHVRVSNIGEDDTSIELPAAFPMRPAKA